MEGRVPPVRKQLEAIREYFSYPDVQDLRDRNTAFQGILAAVRAVLECHA